MAHKTLIGGTAYEISGGKTLVNGTAYSVNNGKTLANGTTYGIDFAKYYYISGRGRTLSGTEYNDSSFDDGCGYVTINGVKYTSRFNNVPIVQGTQISLKVSSSHSDQAYRCSVTLNGQVVQDGGGTYYFTPTNDCMITIISASTIANWTYIHYWKAEITM